MNLKRVIKGLLMGLVVTVSVSGGAQAQAKVKLKTPSIKISSVKYTSAKVTAKNGIYVSDIKKKGKKVYDKISGYQIYRRLGGSGAFKKVFTAKVKRKKITKSKNFSGLKSGTYYAFRIRTYKKVGKKTYYSKWGYAGVTTKKNMDTLNNNNDNTNNDSVPNPTPSSGTCAQMNEQYKNYTVEQMDAIFNADYQRKTVDRVNLFRKNRGLAPYALDPTLCQLAQVRAQENVAMQTWKSENLDKGHYRDSTKSRYWNSIFWDYGVSNIQSFSESVGWGNYNVNTGWFGTMGNIGEWDDVVREVWGGDNYGAVFSNSWLEALSGAVESTSHRKSLIASSVYADCMGVAFVWNAEKTYSVWVYVFGKYK